MRRKRKIRSIHEITTKGVRPELPTAKADDGTVMKPGDKIKVRRKHPRTPAPTDKVSDDSAVTWGDIFGPDTYYYVADSETGESVAHWVNEGRVGEIIRDDDAVTDLERKLSNTDLRERCVSWGLTSREQALRLSRKQLFSMLENHVPEPTGTIGGAYMDVDETEEDHEEVRAGLTEKEWAAMERDSWDA